MFKANNNNAIIDDLIWLADLKTNYYKVWILNKRLIYLGLYQTSMKELFRIIVNYRMFFVVNYFRKIFIIDASQGPK